MSENQEKMQELNETCIMYAWLVVIMDILCVGCIILGIFSAQQRFTLGLLAVLFGGFGLFFASRFQSTQAKGIALELEGFTQEHPNVRVVDDPEYAKQYYREVEEYYKEHPRERPKRRWWQRAR